MNRCEVEELYESYGQGLLSYACGLLNNVSGAEDILHQVFLALLKDSIAMPGNPRAYLFRAMKNALLNARRAQGREVELEPIAEWLAAPPGTDHRAVDIHAALLKIPLEQREVVLMKVWGEMTFAEIAEVCGLPSNTVSSRYRYG